MKCEDCGKSKNIVFRCEKCDVKRTNLIIKIINKKIKEFLNGMEDE